MMMDKPLEKYSLIVGWAVFVIALLTYSFTAESTVSFWDCGEYTATSAKLEVGHPPGASFSQMMGAFIAAFALDTDKITLLVNYMSVLSSAFTVFFLYSITASLAKKVALRSADTLSVAHTVAVIGSGVVGVLAHMFSDSFWFNVVEAEVYAMTMLLMSAMFRLGIKWTDSLHEPRGDRQLLLISLVVGLPFGVHSMALLTIPTTGMLYFSSNNYKEDVWNLFIANVVLVAALLLIFKLILPYILVYFGYLEVYFVNSFGMSSSSDTITAGFILVAFLSFAPRYASQKKKV